MEPMEPMEPMKPMAPMKNIEAWWPSELGMPSTSGGQNGMRYAVFPDTHRLLIERDSERAAYDTGEYRITGVSQASQGDASLIFTSASGTVDLRTLKKLP